VALGGTPHDHYVTVFEVEADGFCGVITVFEVELPGGSQTDRPDDGFCTKFWFVIGMPGNAVATGSVKVQ
jgi:hypothetical protein